MNLVIVESPAKAKTIEKYLGKGYKVIASKGHVMDLPKSTLGIDLEKEFKPQYEVKNKISLAAIKKEFKNADKLILAVDPDREGEAIGWHIAQALKMLKPDGSVKPKMGKGLERIVFTEITKEAVQAAVNSPRSIDMNLVNAQQTRRILDRLVGYQLSPLLWKKMMFGLSAGRVQSVALRLVVEKEAERDAFNTEEYWNLNAYLLEKATRQKVKELILKDGLKDEVEKREGLRFSLVSIKGKKAAVKKEAEAVKVFEKVNGADWVISEIEKKAAKRSPNPPFNTSTLQQAAANQLGMSASRTMRVAQQLYESGLITYMRTDSFNLSQMAVLAVRNFIEREFGKNFIPATARFYKTKSKVAQEAHEAIRPTNISKKPEELGNAGEQRRLYELIWKRVVACQMSDAAVETLSVKIAISDYIFQADGQKIIFPGFLAVHADKFKEQILPELKEGEVMHLTDLIAEQKFTDPPARYTEATLIKALEANGIGRPSTYAPILTNIISKKYIEKEGRFLKPSLVGKALSRLLVEHFSNIMDVKFTAHMEDDLDNIANGELNWLGFLKDFYKGFDKSLKAGNKNINKEDYIILGDSDEKCPECGKKMFIKLGRFSPFLTCSDFPKCKGLLSLNNREGEQIDTASPDFISKYKTAPLTEDGRPFVLKMSRFGHFWAHPDYPKVKEAKSLELNDAMVLELFGKAPKAADGTLMQLRRSRFGYFWSHQDYPKTKEVQKIDNKALQERKKSLGLL